MPGVSSALPCDEAVDPAIEEQHEPCEGLAGEIPRLTLNIVQKVMLTLPPALQGACSVGSGCQWESNRQLGQLAHPLTQFPDWECYYEYHVM